MNRTASETIAAVLKVLTFLGGGGDSSILCCIRILIIIAGNESGDKSNVKYNWGRQKSRFAKSLETSALGDKNSIKFEI